MEKNTDSFGCWSRFLQTGSVADYLNYAASAKREQEGRKQQGHDRADEGDRHGTDIDAGGRL